MINALRVKVDSEAKRQVMNRADVGGEVRLNGNNEAYTEGAIHFNSTRFGELSVAEEKIIRFSSGILGFPEAKRFIILDYEKDVPFKWLQSVDDPALAFMVVEPVYIKPDFVLQLQAGDVMDLGSGDEQDFVVMVILTIPKGSPKDMTANLRGPLVFNSITMKGKQTVVQNESYPLKYKVFS